ncbi:MAG: DUF6888 family protein [Microcystaceae cyanobacterium]
MPTEKQKDTAIFVCQLLSNLLQPILLFRYDTLQKYIFLIAGRELSLNAAINLSRLAASCSRSER